YELPLLRGILCTAFTVGTGEQRACVRIVARQPRHLPRPPPIVQKPVEQTRHKTESIVMADIDIQKKSRGGSIWPWVLGLLIAAALIWLVVEAVNTDDDNLAEDMTVEDGVYPEADDPAMTDEVYGGNTMGDEMGNVSTEADEYLRFIDNMDQQGD